MSPTEVLIIAFVDASCPPALPEPKPNAIQVAKQTQSEIWIGKLFSFSTRIQ